MRPASNVSRLPCSRRSTGMGGSACATPAPRPRSLIQWPMTAILPPRGVDHGQATKADDLQLGNTAERLGAVAEEIEIISTMLKECRLSAQAKTLHSMAEPIQQIIDHLRNGKDLKALLEKEKIRKTGTALMVTYLTKPEGETFKIKRP
jgi:hypothetical protein